MGVGRVTYAKGTSVPVSRSQSEIQDYLGRKGCSSVGVGYQPGSVVVVFAIKNADSQLRHVSFTMPLPDEKHFRRQESLDQAVREKWRALHLAIKSKFVSIEANVETFEEAWLSHIVVPGGGTVGQRVLGPLRESYLNGKDLPPLLGSGLR